MRTFRARDYPLSETCSHLKPLLPQSYSRDGCIFKGMLLVLHYCRDEGCMRFLRSWGMQSTFDLCWGLALSV